LLGKTMCFGRPGSPTLRFSLFRLLVAVVWTFFRLGASSRIQPLPCMMSARVVVDDEDAIAPVRHG